MKKLLIIPIIALSALALTGCGDEIEDAIQQPVERVQDSEEAVDGLNDRTEEEQEQINEEMGLDD